MHCALLMLTYHILHSYHCVVLLLQKTDEQILELYEKIQKDTSWQQTKKQCQELHSKLSYIKELITAFDAAYDKSIANT